MNLLPKASGTRPRVACDISPQGVVAARSAEIGGPLTAVARAPLAEGAVVASLKPGNVVDRVAVAAAVRRALEGIGERPNSHGSDITLVVPDAAVRVLLLEFDALPSKLTEALPIVRFRLKKMLPFDADDAMVTFQMMSTSKTIVRVLAVAVPPDVLREYETAAREAGFEPGAVLPSTLAALAAVEDESPALLINANDFGVTAAIVRSGVLMLHRSVDLQTQPVGQMQPQMQPLSDAYAAEPYNSADEWAQQPPRSEHVRAGEHNFGEPADVTRSPYASPLLDANLSAELHHAILVAPTSLGTLTEAGAGDVAADIAAAALYRGPRRESYQEEPPPQETFLGDGHQSFVPQPIALGEEVAQAVSVAVAYFEDTLAAAPASILSAGPLGAEALGRILAEYGLAQADGLRVRELVETDALLPAAAAASVPPGWLSGVMGALRG